MSARRDDSRFAMSPDGVLLTQMDLFGRRAKNDLSELDDLDDLDEPEPTGLSQDLAPLPRVSLPLAVIPLNRPKTRAGCATVPRPCPFVSCRHNLYLDVTDDGRLKFNFPDREPDQMSASCALDLADDGPRILDTIGGLMGMSKERARQIEVTGLEKVKACFTPEDVD